MVQIGLTLLHSLKPKVSSIKARFLNLAHYLLEFGEFLKVVTTSQIRQYPVIYKLFDGPTEKTGFLGLHLQDVVFMKAKSSYRQ